MRPPTTIGRCCSAQRFTSSWISTEGSGRVFDRRVPKTLPDPFTTKGSGRVFDRRIPENPSRPLRGLRRTDDRDSPWAIAGLDLLDDGPGPEVDDRHVVRRPVGGVQRIVVRQQRQAPRALADLEIAD